MSKEMTTPSDCHLQKGSSPVATGKAFAVILVTLLFCLVVINSATAGDLQDVLKAGKLRHLGIRYANFITNQETGLDVELMKHFASFLGVRYEFVESKWNRVIADLTGKVVVPDGDNVKIRGKSVIRGDAIATGFTVLPWRKKVVLFSSPTFPTGVWLIASAHSALNPVTPTGDIQKDIALVRAHLKGKSVLGLKNSCLDPDLYHVRESGAVIKLFPSERDLSEMIPSVMAGMADATLMDVPVALIALQKWPGYIKVVGPISPPQTMAVAFAKSSPKLLARFEQFFRKFKDDGDYDQLVRKYYPTVFTFYPDFFKKK